MRCMIVLAAAKKWPETTPIVPDLQTIESRKTAFIHWFYPTFYCDFLQAPQSPKNIFCYAELNLQKEFRTEFKLHNGDCRPKKTVG